ncbi:MAG: hypothetical protein MOB07_26940 [Acidobacteria bacterium]|nr:hypothetical protein [Acidobacteriota bacterium]
MVTIQVDPISAEIIRTLNERAEAQGKTLDELLRPLAEAGNGMEAQREATLGEFMDALESLADDTSHLPAERIRYSREDIYFDHD